MEETCIELEVWEIKLYLERLVYKGSWVSIVVVDRGLDNIGILIVNNHQPE